MCIDLHQTGSVGEGSDHLQLIKFWPSCAPMNGVCGGAKIFGSALLQPAHSVCISLSTFFIGVCVCFQLLKSYDKKEDCDLWKDGMFRAKNLRYICISRDTEVNIDVRCHCFP